MCKVFVEYAIKAEERESYLNYMREWGKREGRLELLEGTDQPGLFVEIWNGVEYGEYRELKRQRTDKAEPGAGEADWERWLEGGLRKLHMWHFTPAEK